MQECADKSERNEYTFSENNDKGIALVQKFLWMNGFQRAHWEVFHLGPHDTGDLTCYRADSTEPFGYSEFGSPLFDEWKALEETLFELGCNNFKCSI